MTQGAPTARPARFRGRGAKARALKTGGKGFRANSLSNIKIIKTAQMVPKFFRPRKK